MKPLQIQIEGIGVWAPGLTDPTQLPAPAAIQHHLATAAAGPERRPPAGLLSPNERRRAPEGVLLAVEVAAQAIEQSGRPAEQLLSIFSSSRGDQPITDYMCQTLASDPYALSPTKFHHSVHNAAAGYWSIACAAMGSSSALSGEPGQLGLGLLEAITLAVCEQQPVLWVCSETRGSGALQSLSPYRHNLAAALVLAPATTDTDRPCLAAQLAPGHADAEADSHPVAELLRWLAAMAQDGEHALTVSPQLQLRLQRRGGRL